MGKLWQGGTVGGSCGGGGLFKSSTLSAILCAPHKRYSVCTCTVCLGRSLLCQSLFDSVLIMDFNNIATCLGVTFLYLDMCKVTPYFGFGCRYFLTLTSSNVIVSLYSSSISSSAVSYVLYALMVYLYARMMCVCVYALTACFQVCCVLPSGYLSFGWHFISLECTLYP